MVLTIFRTARPGRSSGSSHFLLSTYLRSFHSSGISHLPRRQSAPPRSNAPDPLTLADAQEGINLEFADDDTTSAGHLVLRQKRKLLYYLRLIEHEMPKLVGERPPQSSLYRACMLMAVAAFRKPFVPPTPDTPLIVRSIDYAGEEHPVTVKRSVVVPVAHLPLRDEDAIHKAKLLAGPRWTPDAPANSGVGREERDGEHGYIKISCEDFPKPAMNLKWASDVLDALIAEANVRFFSSWIHSIDLKPTNMRRIAQTCSRTYHWISVMCTPEPGRRKRENISEIGSDTDRH